MYTYKENKEIPIYDVSQKLEDMREAAKCHILVRKTVRDKLRPNMKLIEIANLVENQVVQVFGKNNFEAGMGFPTGLSLNNCAAHDSAIPGDTRTFKKDDIIKIDFGSHVNGFITDSAFSYAFDPKFDNLIAATKDATMSTIKLVGPDVLIGELSNNIQEVIESYEMEKHIKLIVYVD
jgi:methionyl aminopeptidase